MKKKNTEIPIEAGNFLLNILEGSELLYKNNEGTDTPYSRKCLSLADNTATAFYRGHYQNLSCSLQSINDISDDGLEELEEEIVSWYSSLSNTDFRIYIKWLRWEGRETRLMHVKENGTVYGDSELVEFSAAEFPAGITFDHPFSVIFISP